MKKRRPRIWTVGELIGAVNSLLDEGFANLWVEGEVTNASTSSRGHVYFTLKDDFAALDCVLWSSKAERLRFRVEDGLAVVATGSLTVYAQRGRFQMVVESLQPEGMGALQLAFEQLKKRLSAEGLFADERKQRLPSLPQRVGIVTSLSGAALQDMLRVLSRFSNLETIVADARVQGEGAAFEIANAIARLDRSGLVDLVIVARGGGSLEDLWAFNEERVARAIAACSIPVISGIGHEVDFTIADFVADVRATTPTQAAEIVVSLLEQQQRRLDDASVRLRRDIWRHLQLARTRLSGLEGSSGLARVPQRLRLLRSRFERASQLGPLLLRLLERSQARLARVEAALQRVPGQIAAGGHSRLLASRCQQLGQLMLGRLQRLRATLAANERALIHLSPRKVLERGYSITTIEGAGKPLRDAGQVRSGTILQTTLAQGTVRSVVSGERRKPRPGAPVATQGNLFEEPEEERK
jgi:exodeoxyribonuclease VII large subunit